MTDETASVQAEPLLNRAQIAQIFNVSENTIDKWRAKGMPTEVEGGNGVAYGFFFSTCREWYDETKARAAAEASAVDSFIKKQQMAFLNLDEKDANAGLTPGQMRELAQAQLVWMQAAERRRTLVHVDEMVEMLDAIFIELRAGLDGQPDWLEREFELSGEDVERVVAYNDGILKTIKAAITAAALSEPASVVDPLDQGLI